MTNPLITVEHLTKTFRVPVREAGLRAALGSALRRRYRDVEAVRDMAFAINAGEVVGFLGPNGAGKTTTLKLLSVLLHPTSGSATVASHVPWERRPAYLRQIAMVMGNKSQLWWGLTAADAFRILGTIYRVPPDGLARTRDELVDLLELAPLLDKPVRSLSLGERMKCELVGALIHGPRVLFLDEPTPGLDVAMTYRLALPREEEDGVLRTVHRWVDNASGDPSGFAIAPAVDLAKLAGMLLGGGNLNEGRFLSPESVALMQTRHADRRVAAASHPIAHWTEGYGLGLMLGQYRGARLVQHGGTLQSFDNYFHLFPDAGEEGAGFVLLTNHGDDAAAAELAFALGDLLLGLPASQPQDRVVLLPPLDGAPDWDRWTALEGTYLSARQGRLVSVRVRRGRLQLVQRGQAATLIPAAETYCYEDEGLRIPVAFLRPPDHARATHLFIGGNPYERVALDPTFRPDPSSWSRYTGSYRDPSNLGEGAEWRVSLLKAAKARSSSGVMARTRASSARGAEDRDGGGCAPTLIRGCSTR
jgi:ABC-type Na+ transport system ATPase subunit NatA